MQLATTRHGKKAHVFESRATLCGLSGRNPNLIVFMSDFDPEAERVDCQKCQAALDKRAKRGGADSDHLGADRLAAGRRLLRRPPPFQR